MMKKSREETYQLIISRLSGKDGYLGREVVGDGYFAPSEIRLEKVEDDDALVYIASPYDDVPGHWVRTNRGALDAFIRLAWPDPDSRREGDDVLEFARDWGVLELCEHERPYTHAMGDLFTGASVRGPLVKSPMSRPVLHSGRRCEPVRKTETLEYEGTKFEYPTDECIEYVKIWRLFAEKAVLLLELAASLRARSDPSNEESTRKKLVSRLNKWLDMANVGVVCRDTGKGEWPSGLQIDYINRGGLFGVLSVQLLLATTLNEFLFTCAECGRFFNPAPAERPRKPGERAFCSSCGRKAAMRFASRAYRAREKLKRAKLGR